MTARVHIATATAKDALSVEHNLVFSDHETGDWFVFVRAADAKAEPVKTKVEAEDTVAPKPVAQRKCAISSPTNPDAVKC